MNADEVALAGSVYKKINTKYYLNNGKYTWTLSPSYFGVNYIQTEVLYLTDSGKMDSHQLATSVGARPVINLKSNIEFISGSGTESDPYLVGQN